jgi:pimeloyl-ACP methyl ester carboxylesterase
MERPQYPGAQAPERTYDFDSDGCRLRIHEWGDPAAQPIVCLHGMWDHAHGFDLLAPLLAARYRVIALDARGHGDSAWLDTYSWPHDITDVLRLARSFGRVHLLAHSKAGGVAMQAAICAPEQFDKLINIDGFGPPRNFVTPGEGVRPQPGSPEALAEVLDIRRLAHRRRDWKPYAELDDLVQRRKRQNPRLSEAWLRYFCWHGSRHSPEGYRWKVDPALGILAGPFRPEWIGPSWKYVRAPVLAIIGAEQDTWGPLDPELLDERLQFVADLQRARIDGAGHFPHMEQPALTARLILDYLGS